MVAPDAEQHWGEARSCPGTSLAAGHVLQQPQRQGCSGLAPATPLPNSRAWWALVAPHIYPTTPLGPSPCVPWVLAMLESVYFLLSWVMLLVFIHQS